LDSFCAYGTPVDMPLISDDRRIKVREMLRRSGVGSDNQPIFHEIDRNATPVRAASAA
jgi:hypothetical protein